MFLGHEFGGHSSTQCSCLESKGLLLIQEPPKGPGLGQMPELLFTETDLHKSTLVDLLMSIYDVQGVMS